MSCAEQSSPREAPRGRPAVRKIDPRPELYSLMQTPFFRPKLRLGPISGVTSNVAAYTDFNELHDAPGVTPASLLIADRFEIHRGVKKTAEISRKLTDRSAARAAFGT